MRSFAIAAALMVLVGPAPASAADNDDEADYTFYWQAGIGREQVLADFEECRDLASRVEPPRGPSPYTPNVAAAAAAGFVQGLIRGAQRRHLGDAALRKCLGVKGYGRYGFTKDEAKAMYAGSWQQMRERVADRATGPAPTQPALPQ
jgi:hypothetical protein